MLHNGHVKADEPPPARRLQDQQCAAGDLLAAIGCMVSAEYGGEVTRTVNRLHVNAVKVSARDHALLKVRNHLVPTAGHQSGNMPLDVLSVLGVQRLKLPGIGTVVGGEPSSGDRVEFCLQAVRGSVRSVRLCQYSAGEKKHQASERK